MQLSQTEADLLLKMEKLRIDSKYWEYPQLGGSINIPLTSSDNKQDFMLDIRRGRINLKKGTLQNRAKNVIILARLDYGGAPHRNPDGEEIGGTHLHLYRAGYADKWAYPIDPEIFPDINDASQTLDNFMRYCNIIQPPTINRGLFV